MGPTAKQMEIVEERNTHSPKKEEGGVVSSTAISVVPPSVPTPTSILQDAVQRGANVDTLAKLLELQERWEANEARKAFVKALTAFKANPPRIEKTKEVSFKDTRYKYAPLDEVASIIGTALSKHGLSFRWDTKQIDGKISVSCVLQHELGHSESVTLEGAPDNSGSKNSIQAVGSTVTYLQRYTLHAITGTASANQDSDGITMGEAADFVTLINESASMEDLKKNYTAAVQDALKRQSPKPIAVYLEAKKKRHKELA
jgi:ERF superfamily